MTKLFFNGIESFAFFVYTPNVYFPFVHNQERITLYKGVKNVTIFKNTLKLYSHS